MVFSRFTILLLISLELLEVVLLDGLEGMPEVVGRDVAAQDGPGNTREVVV